MKTIKPRAGSKIYKGVEVPTTAKIYVSKLGREYYISSINEDNTVTIRFIDNEELKTINYDYFISISQPQK